MQATRVAKQAGTATTVQKQWWKEAVVYQVYPRSFQDANGDGIGDIPGIISRLDYIKDLGVDVIWLSPIYASPNVDNGYDISDYYAILSEFGSIADFDQLLQQAHLRGLRIVMDLVVNHTSDQHAWFAESRSGRDNPKRDWYIWRDGYQGEAPNQMESIFSGPAWQLDELTGQYYLHLFAKEQPDLNWDNKEVRGAVYEMMRWWLDKGIDGFRMDVISMISKPEDALQSDGCKGKAWGHGPRVHEYLKEMNQSVLSRYDIMTVGETSDVTVEEAKNYAGFDTHELSMVFQFELMNIDRHETLGKWSTKRFCLRDFRDVMTKWQNALDGVAWNSLYLSNHDQPRAVSHFGDTSSELFWEKSAKMLATCLYMMQGTPYIYQGEELGMTNMAFESLDDIRDLESRNAYRELVEEKKIYAPQQMMSCIQKCGRDNARTPMQWDDSPNGGFTSAKPWIRANPNYVQINAARQQSDPHSVLHYYRKLIQSRKENPIIVYGSYELQLPDDENVFAYYRHYEGKRLLVVCNFSDRVAQSSELSELMAQSKDLLLGNYPQGEAPAGSLLPYEARVTWC